MGADAVPPDAAPPDAVPPDPILDLLLAALPYGPQRLRALGGSMWPTIPHGTEVELCAPSSGGPPGLMEVVAVRTRTGRFLIHRVVGLAADGSFLLLGDACVRPDGWMTPAEWVARVPRMRIKGGWAPVPMRPLAPPPWTRRLLPALRRRIRVPSFVQASFRTERSALCSFVAPGQG